jgi:hypothetical protein
VNPAWALPLVIVMQTRSAGVSPRPVAWAVQSPRPAVCSGRTGLWEASKQALWAGRCRELSRAQALLVGAPAKAHDAAAQLLAEAPDFAEARVVRGRASLRLRDGAGALADLRPLLDADVATVAAPAALLDGGRAALLQSDLSTAARFYRALGSRAALLPDRKQQVVGYIEIAATLVATDAAGDDVRAFLREARRRSAGSGLSGLCAALAALSWVAEGREADAQGALAELGDPESLERFRQAKLVSLPGGVLDASLALALERDQPELAAKHWKATLDAGLAGSRLGKLAARPSKGAKRSAK